MIYISTMSLCNEYVFTYTLINIEYKEEMCTSG